ncbi:MAG: HzsA-related protein [Planctomycetota bacterium]
MRSTLVLACALACAPAFGRPKTVKVKVQTDSEAGGYECFRAMDGNPTTIWHTVWGAGETDHPHELVVDLGASYRVSGFTYLPRPGGGNGTINAYEFFVSDNKKSFAKPAIKGTFPRRGVRNAIKLPAVAKGRYVKLRSLSEVSGKPWASVAELGIISDGVQFIAERSSGPLLRMPTRAEPSGATGAETESARQYKTLVGDIRNRGKFARFASQVYRREATILPSDRDPLDVVLRRTASLLADLKRHPSTADLAAMGKELEGLHSSAGEVGVDNADERFKLFEKACKLRRKIAFSNPLLDFDKILFIKRHRPGFNHMCDQYYGINSKPGGGLYVLSKPFGEDPTSSAEATEADRSLGEGGPKVRDVLARSVVRRGRLRGKKLEGGSFLSPDLSYDGKTIMFAYVECTGDRGHKRHTDASRGHWSEGRSYHVFKVNVDGSALEQLTDGTWNDFDPCWLPNGRVVFISERRGGYLRCGRTCPTYTLHDMTPDGTDLRCLSFHETNEWHPSVTHDGMIAYTRWDYVDRHGCVTHLPWVTTLDGRDARAVHGNFAPREARPDMELDILAIPGSHKYIATAAPHHGQAFGSLVMFDPHIEDDDGMGPVKRLTPEVGFPESQGGSQVYATGWPLSEDYYLCVYDSSMKPGVGRQGRRHVRGNYGIYLVDAFGNKELVYRDPAIACQSPMPLRARPKPHVMPELARRHKGNGNGTAAGGGTLMKPAEGTLGVINVYKSLKPWPAGARIKSLRVYQIIPMSVPSGGPPHEIGLRLPGAEGSDSVILARHVLGTVPVEEDGSAHFVVPARRELFFQALDERGLAIQSMRSSTYLQAGERLVCQGCHEPRHGAPRAPANLPVALRRAPSRPKPDVDGSNPFSYPRLVQPVLEKHCLPCHTKNPKKAPRLDREVVRKGRQKWYRSYFSLAPKYGFWRYGDRHRTTPGRFGARASRLFPMLDKGHNKLKLPPEDLHRIALWLDSCSIFYGVYEKEGGEAQLRGEVVKPTLE